MNSKLLIYNNLLLSSEEIINFRINKEFGVVSNPTVSMTDITQPGSLKATRIDITSKITNDSQAKFNQWMNLIERKPLETLTFLGKVWGDTYLTSVNISSNELDKQGFILRMGLNLTFIVNQTFRKLEDI